MPRRRGWPGIAYSGRGRFVLENVPVVANLPIVIQPGGSVGYGVAFRPMAPGQRSATVEPDDVPW